MPVTSIELIGRRVSGSSIIRRYYFHGPATEAEVITAYTNTTKIPPSVSGLPLASIESEEVQDIAGDWLTVATYGLSNSGTPLQPQALGTLEYEFNYQAPSAHIKQGLATVGAWVRPGAPAPEDFGGLIGVVEGPDGIQVEGIDIAPPAETFSLNYSAAGNAITTSFQLLVESMVGKVNSFAFKNRPAGSLFLTRVSGGVTSRANVSGVENTWNVKFGFAYSPNQTTPFTVGSITVPGKLGWDLLWTYDTPQHDAAAMRMVVRPHTAFVERIFETANFNLLGLPSLPGGS